MREKTMRCGWVGRAAFEDKVLGKLRSPDYPNAGIDADAVLDGVLEEEKFQRLGAHEAQVVHVGDELEVGGELRVSAGVEEREAWIDEVGLAFVFFRDEIGEEAVGRVEGAA